MWRSHRHQRAPFQSANDNLLRLDTAQSLNRCQSAGSLAAAISAASHAYAIVATDPGP
ncbi:MAG: hypothetical protein OXH04_21305 [Acidobacteria bacterium]|nr:hypothetical protein [Acidobacteriota bacterium]